MKTAENISITLDKSYLAFGFCIDHLTAKEQLPMAAYLVDQVENIVWLAFEGYIGQVAISDGYLQITANYYLKDSAISNLLTAMANRGIPIPEHNGETVPFEYIRIGEGDPKVIMDIMVDHVKVMKRISKPVAPVTKKKVVKRKASA
jgi:hypothetical protein